MFDLLKQLTPVQSPSGHELSVSEKIEQLARKYGVTERWVRQLCGEGKLEGQMSLLDYGDEPENTTF